MKQIRVFLYIWKIKGSLAFVNLYFLCNSPVNSVSILSSSQCWTYIVRVPACASIVAVSSDGGGRWNVGRGLVVPTPLLKNFTVCPCHERKKDKQKLSERGGRRRSAPPHRLPPSSSTPVLSLVVIVFLLFAVRQRCARPDLPVPVQPLLHHLRDEWVVAAARAFLKSHQDATVGHATVQPFAQQLLLLLFITHLKEKQMRPLEGATAPIQAVNNSVTPSQINLRGVKWKKQPV